MATRDVLLDWVISALKDLGPARPVEVAKFIWKMHKAELESSGNLFFTWQYDMRWAAQKLRNQGKAALSPDRKWILVK